MHHQSKLIFEFSLDVMHAYVCGLEVQTDLEIKVRHVGVQCDLLCPQDSSPRPESLERNSGPVTSTPIKDSIPVAVTDVDISDVSDIEYDTTTVDATESTAYYESSTSTMESMKILVVLMQLLSKAINAMTLRIPNTNKEVMLYEKC